MKVKFTNERRPCTANIIWLNRFPMRGGKFPSAHPVTPSMMAAFREKGYWASCFPEGDGITFYSLSEPKPDEQVIKDIEECFGFTVAI